MVLKENGLSKGRAPTLTCFIPNIFLWKDFGNFILVGLFGLFPIRNGPHFLNFGWSLKTLKRDYWWIKKGTSILALILSKWTLFMKVANSMDSGHKKVLKNSYYVYNDTKGGGGGEKVREREREREREKPWPFIFMPRRLKIRGHVVFVLSVILSFSSPLWNFNLANNFWTVSAI